VSKQRTRILEEHLTRSRVAPRTSQTSLALVDFLDARDQLIYGDIERLRESEHVLKLDILSASLNRGDSNAGESDQHG
jgi:hypothetical protein